MSGQATQAPARCTSCGGTGNGQTVYSGNGAGVTEKCNSCGGTGERQ